MLVEELVDKKTQAFSHHDADGWAGPYDENAGVYDPRYPDPLRAIRNDVEDLLRAFPDIQSTSRDAISTGGRLASHGIGWGTSIEPLDLPTGSIPATNRRAEIPAASFRWLDMSGLIAEERRYHDLAGMLIQLGLTTK